MQKGWWRRDQPTETWDHISLAHDDRGKERVVREKVCHGDWAVRPFERLGTVR